MKSDIHVKITGTRPLKTIILTSAKSVAEQLQVYNKLKKIRDEKRKKIEQIDNLLWGIREAFEELKVKDISYRGQFEKEVVEKKEIKSQVIVPRLDRQELQLAKELEDIERKLASL